MGVEFTIELMDKIDAAVRASKELDNVAQGAKRADDATRKFEKSTGMLGKALSGAGGFLRQFGAHLGALAAWEGIKSGIDMVTELGKSAFEAAAGAQRLEKSFAFMFGKERGNRLLEQADKTAKVSQFSDEVQKGAQQSLLAAGFQGEKRLQVLRSAAADIAGKTGTGLGGFQGAIGLFQQMQTTNAAPMARALKEMGLGEGAGKAIEKEMATGLSAVDAFLTVLQRSNQGKPFGAIDEEMAKLADVRWKKLMDLPNQYFQQLSKTDAFDKLSTKLGEALSAFDPDSPRGQKVMAGLERMITKLIEMFEKIDFDRVANTMLRLFEALPPLIEGTTKAILGLSEAFGKVVKPENIEQFERGWSRAKTLARVGDTVGTILSPTRLVGRGAEALTDYFFGQKSGQRTAEGMAKGLKDGTPKAADASAGMGEAVEKANRESLGIQSPSRVFAQLGAYTSMGFAAGIDDAMPDVAASMSQFSPEALVPDLMPSSRVSPISVTASGGGGGTTVEAHIIVNVSAGGQGGEAQAREVGQAAADGTRQAIQSLFEQMAAEGG